VKCHIPVASRFGAVIIIGLIRGILKPGIDHRQAMDWLVAALQECCQAAREHGTSLVLEPINRYETTLIQATRGELIKVGADNSAYCSIPT
jgi:sugar phosphate isomerase/epimerase